jgi:ribosomal protein L32E
MTTKQVHEWRREAGMTTKQRLKVKRQMAMWPIRRHLLRPVTAYVIPKGGTLGRAASPIQGCK